MRNWFISMEEKGFEESAVVPSLSLMDLEIAPTIHSLSAASFIRTVDGIDFTEDSGQWSDGVSLGVRLPVLTNASGLGCRR